MQRGNQDVARSSTPLKMPAWAKTSKGTGPPQYQYCYLPVRIRIFCPKTTNFGPKLAFLVNLGQAMQAYSVPCWWVGWWLWRAGCISQDTYLLYNHDCDKASICDALEKCLCLFCAKKRFLRIVNPAHTSSKDELAAIQILIAEDLSTNTCKYMQNNEINICILLRG